MATGNYGINRPASVSIGDIDVYYTFSPTRDSPPVIPLTPLPAIQVLSQLSPGISSGMYNLQLPATTFSTKGIYSILIKPKETQTTITDCGVLSALPDIKGIIIDLNSIGIQDAASLIGYRVEYFDANNNRIPNFFRVITSANRAEVVNANLSNTTQKAVRYRFNDSSNLAFCTLTPSSAPNVRPNQFPEIGSPGQRITISNTFFNPILLEVDMVEYDIETLAYALYGNQSKSVQDGIYTIYDFQNNIYKQYSLYDVLDTFNQNEPLYEIREQILSPDFTKDFNTITNTNT